MQQTKTKPAATYIRKKRLNGPKLGNHIDGKGFFNLLLSQIHNALGGHNASL
jgi:hypothetical protein